MNVFDLPGPQFLVFYILCAMVVGGVAWGILSLPASRRRAAAPALLADPFQIACLRGGLIEVARMGVLSLADQTLVELARAGIIQPLDRREPRGLGRVERAILVNCPRPQGRTNVVLRSQPVRAACAAICACATS